MRGNGLAERRTDARARLCEARTPPYRCTAARPGRPSCGRGERVRSSAGKRMASHAWKEPSRALSNGELHSRMYRSVTARDNAIAVSWSVFCPGVHTVAAPMRRSSSRKRSRDAAGPSSEGAAPAPAEPTLATDSLAMAIHQGDGDSDGASLSLVRIAAHEGGQRYSVAGSSTGAPQRVERTDLLTLEEAARWVPEKVGSGLRVGVWQPQSESAIHLQEELQCTICLGLLCRPHVIPCGHTFCGAWCVTSANSPAALAPHPRRRSLLSSLAHALTLARRPPPPRLDPSQHLRPRPTLDGRADRMPHMPAAPAAHGARPAAPAQRVPRPRARGAAHRGGECSSLAPLGAAAAVCSPKPRPASHSGRSLREAKPLPSSA